MSGKFWTGSWYAGAADFHPRPIDHLEQRVLYLLLRHKVKTGDYPKRLLVGQNVMEELAPNGQRWLKVLLPPSEADAIRLLTCVQEGEVPSGSWVVETVQVELDDQPNRCEVDQ